MRLRFVLVDIDIHDGNAIFSPATDSAKDLAKVSVLVSEGCDGRTLHKFCQTVRRLAHNDELVAVRKVVTVDQTEGRHHNLLIVPFESIDSVYALAIT